MIMAVAKSFFYRCPGYPRCGWVGNTEETCQTGQRTCQTAQRQSVTRPSKERCQSGTHCRDFSGKDRCCGCSSGSKQALTRNLQAETDHCWDQHSGPKRMASWSLHRDNSNKKTAPRSAGAVLALLSDSRSSVSPLLCSLGSPPRTNTQI